MSHVMRVLERLVLVHPDVVCWESDGDASNSFNYFIMQKKKSGSQEEEITDPGPSITPPELTTEPALVLQIINSAIQRNLAENHSFL